MNGLLDDPGQVGLLSMGLRLLSTPGKFGAAFGQAGLGAMGDVQQAKAAQDVKKTRAMQEQMQLLQLQQIKAQQERQAAADARKTKDDDILRGAFQPMPGPMPDGSAGVAPRFDLPGMLGRGLSMDGVPEALNLNKAFNPPRKLTAYKPGDQVRDEAGAVAFSVPESPEKKPEALRALAAVYGEGSPEYQQAARQYAQKLTTHQPGTSVSVNTGQKGLDNTLKLRGDFRSEPIYKAHQDVQSAHSQITTALKQASPAGDLAGATKLMKILDPGSVVRESELGMAMAASGMVDRMQNYASMVMSGQKLTPTQRKDFMTLADALRVESEKQYNAKRKEYQGIADRNGLNVDDVLGPASTGGAGGGWSITRVP